MSKQRTAVSPTREENYPEWYQQVIKVADLAEHSPVRGCMVIKPWGYSLWENIKLALDKEFKKKGVQNAYFPLFIPLSYLEKEAAHVKGFAKECAVVTHHRLEEKDGKLVPAGELEEPLVVRPTSETIIGEMYSKWIESYRDLPLKLNQWCNIVRWEMRTRLFLRTTEILWQEGHTAHETKEEALDLTKQMLDVYVDITENHLAIPVIKGRKTEAEKFPGADETFTFEAMMQDGKALQMGTSHFLGQNFAKASDITFMPREGNLEHVWTTSWGVTTRLIGAIIMAHSDDNGLVLPPRVASSHIVIIPFVNKEETKEKVYNYCKELKKELEELTYFKKEVEVIFDDRDQRAGEKAWYWIKKGIPIRIEVGPKEIDDGSVSLFKRTDGPKDRIKLSKEEILRTVPDLLDNIQTTIFKRAKEYRDKRMVKLDTKEEFYEYFSKKDCGFALAHYSAEESVEEKIQQDLNVTVRCIPLDLPKEEGVCPFTGAPSKQRVVFAKSY